MPILRVAHAATVVACRRCGRSIEDAKSRAAGIGPICITKDLEEDGAQEDLDVVEEEEEADDADE